MTSTSTPQPDQSGPDFATPDSAGPPTQPAPVSAESAAPLPGSLKETERPHPATPLLRGWLVFVALFFGMAQQFIPDGDDNELELSDLRWILLGLAAVVLIAAGAGFVSWYFTRFVIDDEELRIETGVLFKNSKKIPFDRLQSVDLIQPLAARIFGLAELRLEAGAGDSTTKLRYLKRDRASQLRDYLLTRAHGQSAAIARLGDNAPASRFTDLGRADRRLVTVPPARLVLGFLLSSELLITVIATVAAGVATLVADLGVAALGGILPLAVGIGSLVSKRVIGMFNFTLAESPRGLRITRGLTNLTSQSVPIDRIQGVRITQPILWRRFDLFRVDVDIVGYAKATGEDNDDNATSVLLPVATGPETQLALSRILPGIDPDRVKLHPSPHRARWVRWFDFWTLRYGWDDQVIVTEHGWLRRTRNLVPHAKTQSVRITQGPLQRRLRLADVHFDTPKGPVHAVAEELDEQVARELALSQLDRARAARAAPAAAALAPASSDPEPSRTEVLARFGIADAQPIGGGGETEVYALDEQRVLRIYHQPHSPDDQTVTQLQHLYGMWQYADIGVDLPLILDAGPGWTVDRRFRGTPCSPWLAAAPREQRRQALLSLLDACDQVRRLPSPLSGFARLVGREAPEQFATMADLAANMLAGPTARSRKRLLQDLPEVGQIWDRLLADLSRRQVQPQLVHGDICPANAYVSISAGGPVVSGIGDFSPHTVHGDPVMDLTAAVTFVELEPYADAAEDARWLQEVVGERHGPETAYWIGVYRRFYGFYFSDACAFDEALYAWCLRQLRQ